ncbi:MAG: hypothetical protein H6817_04410 [Phycisphaerales bacterium]|nr:hypothetical protein [Phycisphaerales bacterium]
MMNQRIRRITTTLAAILLFAPLSGCAFNALLHATSSLGGTVAGQRGNTQVLFINNTPYRAIFTFGAYDELDQNTEPTLQQFSSDASTLDLEGNTQSDTIDVQCARVYSIGGTGLITRVRANLDEGSFDETSLVEGVNFSSAGVDDDDADAATEGKAAAHNALIGVDFECGALLIYRFEVNDAGPEPFIVELTVIPAEDNRG